MTQSGIGNEPIPSKYKWCCNRNLEWYKQVLTKIISKEELLPPMYNPFVMTSLRPPRTSNNLDEPLDASGVITSDRKCSVLKPGQIRMHLQKIHHNKAADVPLCYNFCHRAHIKLAQSKLLILNFGWHITKVAISSAFVWTNDGTFFIESGSWIFDPLLIFFFISIHL